MAKADGMFGRSDDEWQRLTDATVTFLRQQAGLGRTTNYTEVNQTLERRTGARRFDFDLDSERAAMGHLLGRAVDVELEATGLMLSAIVLYLNENDAGQGFYTKAQELGLLATGASRDARLTFWAQQVAAVHEHYAAPRRGHRA